VTQSKHVAYETGQTPDRPCCETDPQLTAWRSALQYPPGDSTGGG